MNRPQSIRQINRKSAIKKKRDKLIDLIVTLIVILVFMFLLIYFIIADYGSIANWWNSGV